MGNYNNSRYIDRVRLPDDTDYEYLFYDNEMHKLFTSEAFTRYGRTSLQAGQAGITLADKRIIEGSCSVKVSSSGEPFSDWPVADGATTDQQAGVIYNTTITLNDTPVQNQMLVTALGHRFYRKVEKSGDTYIAGEWVEVGSTGTSEQSFFFNPLTTPSGALEFDGTDELESYTIEFTNEETHTHKFTSSIPAGIYSFNSYLSLSGTLNMGDTITADPYKMELFTIRIKAERLLSLLAKMIPSTYQIKLYNNQISLNVLNAWIRPYSTLSARSYWDSPPTFTGYSQATNIDYIEFTWHGGTIGSTGANPSNLLDKMKFEIDLNIPVIPK